MKLRWLRAFIVLTAALIVCISNIVSKRPMPAALVWLLIVILVFFFIGSLVTRIIQRTMSDSSKNKESEPSESVTDVKMEDKTPDEHETVQENEEK